MGQMRIGVHRHIEPHAPTVEASKNKKLDSTPPLPEAPKELINQQAKRVSTTFIDFLNNLLRRGSVTKLSGAAVTEIKPTVTPATPSVSKKTKEAPPAPLKNKKFVHITSGAAKAVHIVKENASDTEAKHVYYTPVKGLFEKIFGSKKAEIREEVVAAAKIQDSLNSKGLVGESYIATDLEEIKGYDNLEGQYVVKAPKAGENGKKIDLDKLLAPVEGEAPPPREAGFEFGRQILSGLKNLHDAGYVHGDLKGDNILHFREALPNGEVRSVLRIADFGKARQVDDNGSVLHTGNPRYAAPEGRTSKKSEVFSAALLLVRNLEEEVLQATNQDMVISPDQVKSDQKGKGLRGIEKFVVTNENCLQTNNKNIPGKIRLISGAARAILNVRDQKTKSSSEEVGKYIDALFSNLKENVTQEQATALDKMNGLLKQMISEDPNDRPTMGEALAEYEECIRLYKGGIS